MSVVNDLWKIGPEDVNVLKTALIHSDICWNDKRRNISKLLTMNEEAAKSGARLILNPEMATSGYGFSSREEIAQAADMIPGLTTDAFGSIAKKYACYICLGLPEKDEDTGIFYNSAVLIGPAGDVLGKCRKVNTAWRENLWAAEGNMGPLVVNTEFGKVGVIICADGYSYKPARIAALRGAKLLLILANWPSNYHNPEKYWQARALENGMWVLVCNRTGMDRHIDCRSGESFVINYQGEILERVFSLEDTIIPYCLPLHRGEFSWSKNSTLLDCRRPSCYGNIVLTAFSSLNSANLYGLPSPGEFTVGIVQFQSIPNQSEFNEKKVLDLIKMSRAQADANGQKIDLLIFPELSWSGFVSAHDKGEQSALDLSGEGIEKDIELLVQEAAAGEQYIVMGIVEKSGAKLFNSCLLVGPKGIEGVYRKVHLSPYDKNWAEPGTEFPAFDLPFARIGMLTGNDLLFPESTESLAKMGTDLVCVSSFWDHEQNKFIWEARLGEQMHLCVANQWGQVGDFPVAGQSTIFSFHPDPEECRKIESPAEGNCLIHATIQAENARKKKFVEKVNYHTLLYQK
ncbi:MAG: carbon-nitrogen hydrolase family protein [Dehalobacterium sp.]